MNDDLARTGVVFHVVGWVVGVCLGMAFLVLVASPDEPWLSDRLVLRIFALSVPVGVALAICTGTVSVKLTVALIAQTRDHLPVAVLHTWLCLTVLSLALYFCCLLNCRCPHEILWALLSVILIGLVPLHCLIKRWRHLWMSPWLLLSVPPSLYIVAGVTAILLAGSYKPIAWLACWVTALGGLVGILVADSVLLHRFLSKYSATNLLACRTGFQFSLKGLVLCCLAFGGWLLLIRSLDDL